MTVIFDNGNLWIENLDVPQSSIPATTVNNFDQTLGKAGHFVGISIALDTFETSAASMRNFTVAVKRIDNAQLIYGQQISQIRVVIANNQGAARTLGCHVIVYMKL